MKLILMGIKPKNSFLFEPYFASSISWELNKINLFAEEINLKRENLLQNKVEKV